MAEFTPHYNLDLYEGSDKPNLRDQHNAANYKIDDILFDHEGRIESLEDRMTKAEAAIIKNAEDIATLDKKVDDGFEDIYKKIQIISDRVTVNEGDIRDIKVDITNIKGDITDIKGDITNINGEITTINNKITNINGEITNINNKITNIQGDITNIHNDITNIIDGTTPIEGAGKAVLLYAGGQVAFATASALANGGLGNSISFTAAIPDWAGAIRITWGGGTGLRYVGDSAGTLKTAVTNITQIIPRSTLRAAYAHVINYRTTQQGTNDVAQGTYLVQDYVPIFVDLSAGTITQEVTTGSEIERSLSWFVSSDSSDTKRLFNVNSPVKITRSASQYDQEFYNSRSNLATNSQFITKVEAIA